MDGLGRVLKENGLKGVFSSVGVSGFDEHVMHAIFRRHERKARAATLLKDELHTKLRWPDSVEVDLELVLPLLPRPE